MARDGGVINRRRPAWFKVLLFSTLLHARLSRLENSNMSVLRTRKDRFHPAIQTVQARVVPDSELTDADFAIIGRMHREIFAGGRNLERALASGLLPGVSPSFEQMLSHVEPDLTSRQTGLLRWLAKRPGMSAHLRDVTKHRMRWGDGHRESTINDWHPHRVFCERLRARLIVLKSRIQLDIKANKAIIIINMSE